MTNVIPSEEITLLMKEIENEYQTHFPNGFISVTYSSGILESIYLVFGVQSRSKHVNNIMNNDPALHTLFMFGFDDGDFVSDKVRLSVSQGGSLLTKPDPDTHYAFGRVKTGLRQKTGTPTQVKKHLFKYFKKLRQTVEDNRDILAHEID